MPGKMTYDRHEALMTAMARTLGADLDEAELRGNLTPELRVDMVLACTGCSNPGGCKTWLAAHPAAEATPDYCRNTNILSQIAAE